MTLDPPSVPANGDNVELDCTLELKPSAQLSNDQVRTSICLVFDCSKSMAGERIRAATKAARHIVDSSPARNTISLVAFSSKSHTLVREQEATPQGKVAMREKIDTLGDLVHGATNMAAGIRRGMLAVKRSTADAKVMIVLSDGVAKKTERAEAAALAASEAGIHLFAVGLGPNSGIDRLQRILAPSSGTVVEQRDAGKILETFNELLDRIRQFVATNVSVDLKFGEGVVPKRVLRTSPGRAKIGMHRLPRLNVGNMERTLAYRFEVSLGVAAQAAGDFEVLRATLTYDVPSLALRNQTKDVSVKLKFERPKVVEPPPAERPAVEPPPVERARPGRPVAERPAAARSSDDRPLFVERPPPAIKKAVPYKKKVFAAAPVLPEEPTEVETITVYDVLLIEPGEDLILVLREVRHATGLSLRKVMEIIHGGGGPIQEDVEDSVAAEAFRQRLEAAGARAEVRSREIRVRRKRRGS